MILVGWAISLCEAAARVTCKSIYRKSDIILGGKASLQILKQSRKTEGRKYIMAKREICTLTFAVARTLSCTSNGGLHVS